MGPHQVTWPLTLYLYLVSTNVRISFKGPMLYPIILFSARFVASPMSMKIMLANLFLKDGLLSLTLSEMSIASSMKSSLNYSL